MTDSIDAPSRPLTVAIVGNPNTGKSTLFNMLTGMRARVGNFPGVTVEKKIGEARWDGRRIRMIDLPGTYSLSPRSPDEMVSVQVLLGLQPEIGPVDAVVCILDASNLERNLYLASQVLDLGLPTVLVLNMWDVAESRGIRIDCEALAQRLGVPVIPTIAHRRWGLDRAMAAIAEAAEEGRGRQPAHPFPPLFYEACEEVARGLSAESNGHLPPFLIERLILDVGGEIETRLVRQHGAALSERLREIRHRLADQGLRVPLSEAKVRYAWARRMLDGLVTIPPARAVTISDRIDKLLTHRFVGLIVFCLLMFLVFQAIYSWSAPLMDALEGLQEWAARGVRQAMAPGPLRSLLVDGVIAGVGSVLVFLPQIGLLFLFIAVLEDCGYMARAAFLMDKLMTRVGLSGKSFVPLMSSFACAVPGVMATRVIENYLDRMVTILVAPLMSCSARLPIYLLLIAAFIPNERWLGGWVSLQGLVLFAVMSLGVVVAVPVAWLLKKTVFRGETPPFVMELPTYKWPSPRIVFHRVYDRCAAFVTRAGTVIFVATVLVWAASYFPGDHSELDRVTAQIEQMQQVRQAAQTGSRGQAVPSSLDDLIRRRNRLSGELVEESFLGRMGRGIEPLVRPLGWDWRIGVGVIASFPAREVIIATLGTLYSLGGEVGENDEGLQAAIRQAKRPDGRPVFSVPVALSLMVFFALCAQCVSTLAVIRRETNSWRWPIFAFTYMTLLAFVGALLTYQIGIRLG